MAKVEVKNLQRLVRKLNDLEKLEAIKPALQAAALHVKGVIAVYPPSSEANTPGQKRWYERGYGPRWPGGGRKTSEILGKRWTIKARDGGLTQVVGNNASYAVYVQSKERQAWFHAKRGWKTDREVLASERDQIVKLLTDSVRKVLERKT
jgi:hypothetical protein